MSSNQTRIGSTLTNADELISRVSSFDPKYNPVPIAFTIQSEKTGKKEDAKGKSFTTLGFHMRAIRAIRNKAKDDKLLEDSDYPFKVKRTKKFMHC